MLEFTPRRTPITRQQRGSSLPRRRPRCRFVGEYDCLDAVAQAELEQDGRRRGVFTVASVTTSRAAISAFDRPCATSTSTSRSRGVSSASAAAGGRSGSRRAAKSSISRRVIDGASSASPAAHDADRRDELLGRRVLEQEAARAGSQRGVDVLVEVERGQDQHARSAAGRECSRAGGLDAVHAGHADVHQHDVGRGARATVGPPRRRRRPRRPPRCPAGPRGPSGSRLRTSSWSSTITTRMLMPATSTGQPRRHPKAAARRARPVSSSPPSSATRSRMPTRPWPAHRRRSGAAGPPSSTTSSSSPESADLSVTTTLVARACLSTLVSASWTMR